MLTVSEQGMAYLMPINDKHYPFEPSTIENIDAGFLDHIDNVFDVQAVTNNGVIKVPVVWLASERAFQAKDDRGIRDSIGKLKLPIITVERTSIEKDKTFKGAVHAHIEPGKSGPRSYKSHVFPIAKRIVQNKTRNFASADVKRKSGSPQENQTGFGQDYFPLTKRIASAKVVYQEISIPLPTYVAVMYTINIRAEYQQQINDMVTPFITKTGQLNHFVIEKNKHRYEAFIQQSFAQNDNTSNLGEDERSFHTKIDVKVLGYLNGGGLNEPKPKITTKENLVELRISRERVIVGDEIPWKTKDKKYRE